jgi:hypothetical protein
MLATNHHMHLVGLVVALLVLVALLGPQVTESHYLKRKQIKALKKVAVAATVLGQRKKVMIPLPVPLPFPIPIINKHEPIISPIDPLLTITAAKGAKGYYPHYYPGFGGIHGGYGGFAGRR